MTDTRKFVAIHRFLRDEESRTLAAAAACYEDCDGLLETISALLDEHLPADAVPGKRVLLKPNWVRHRDVHNPHDAVCLRTNDNFLLAAIEAVLRRKPRELTVAEAPVQMCNWEVLMRDLRPRITRLAEKYDIPIEVCDLRHVVMDEVSRKQRVNNPIGNYLIFDTGKDSLLEPVCDDRRQPFRVTCYDPRRLAENHYSGVHRYCVAKVIFDQDLIITLPKVKTHQKTGMTNAMKILVGINGDKDYLPHHRVGGTKNRGDCYPGGNLLRRFSEFLLDVSNRRNGTAFSRLLIRIAYKIWNCTRPTPEHQLSAGWHGNDTCWRMVADLNRIVRCGRADGTLSPTPLRTIYSLCDGIVCGEGDGPLLPKAYPLDAVLFSNCNELCDLAAGNLMGIDIRHVPLLKYAEEQLAGATDTEVLLNGRPVELEALRPASGGVEMPPGWKRYDR